MDCWLSLFCSKIELDKITAKPRAAISQEELKSDKKAYRSLFFLLLAPVLLAASGFGTRTSTSLAIFAFFHSNFKANERLLADQLE